MTQRGSRHQGWCYRNRPSAPSPACSSCSARRPGGGGLSPPVQGGLGRLPEGPLLHLGAAIRALSEPSGPSERGRRGTGLGVVFGRAGAAPASGRPRGASRTPVCASPWLWAPPHPSALLCPPHGTVGAVEGAPLSGGRSDPVPHVSSLSASCSSPSQRRLPRRGRVDRLSWGAGLARVYLATSLVSLRRETLRPGRSPPRPRVSPVRPRACSPQRGRSPH